MEETGLCEESGCWDGTEGIGARRRRGCGDPGCRRDLGNGDGVSSPASEGKRCERDRIVKTRAPKRRGSERKGA